jgi:hypothetical protein
MLATIVKKWKRVSIQCLNYSSSDIFTSNYLDYPKKRKRGKTKFGWVMLYFLRVIVKYESSVLYHRIKFILESFSTVSSSKLSFNFTTDINSAVSCCCSHNNSCIVYSSFKLKTLFLYICWISRSIKLSRSFNTYSKFYTNSKFLKILVFSKFPRQLKTYFRDGVCVPRIPSTMAEWRQIENNLLAASRCSCVPILNEY